MKIALVHDYLMDYGGAERVFETLHRIYPQAPIYTILVDEKRLGKFYQRFSDTKITESWFSRLPFASRLISPLRFLLPLIWNSFDFSKYDLVITSASWAITKGVKKGNNTKEICYLHTPPRSLYGYDTSWNWKDKWYGWIIDIYALVVSHFLRIYDFNQAQKVDYYIANSKNVGRRIEKFYRRQDYQVIYPPIDVEKIISSKIKPKEGDYFLTGGRLVNPKNFDLIIKACQRVKVNLKIFGSGPQEDYLKSLADSSVEFVGKISDEELVSYYKGAKAFIVAQGNEDFGMTPVEASAAGCPVIAYRAEGYLESVIEGKTGILFDELSEGSIAGAIKKLKQTKINKGDCVKHAIKFSTKRFEKEIKEFVSRHS